MTKKKKAAKAAQTSNVSAAPAAAVSCAESMQHVTMPEPTDGDQSPATLPVEVSKQEAAEPVATIAAAISTEVGDVQNPVSTPGSDDTQLTTATEDVASEQTCAQAGAHVPHIMACSIAEDEVARSVVAVESGSTETGSSLVPFRAFTMELDLNLIDPNPFNRKESVELNLKELADSIAQHGVQSEIKVRPKGDGRYEIVYGERRYRASILAGKTTIPAKIEAMTDEQAEIAAIIENMQRENYTPFEEGEIFCRQMEKGVTVEGLCLLFGKSETYVRTRINLTRLIPEVAELLRKKEISIEMAKEFANYEQKIQQEVYNQYFQDGHGSWKGIPAKEFARRMYERYMTKLDSYHFDKTECTTCQHNTHTQVLFTMCGDCAGCQNPTCLQQKNEAYLTERCVSLVAEDPRIHLTYNSGSSAGVVERLMELGHEVAELERPTWQYRKKPDMPEAPDPGDYEDEDDLAFAQEDYQDEIRQYDEACTEIDAAVTEGKMKVYAVIGNTDIEIYYEPVREHTVTENGITQAVMPDIPAQDLRKKDARNQEIRNEHTTSDLKVMLRQESEQFPTSNIKPRERELFYYVVLNQLRHEHLTMLGLDGWRDDTQRLKLAETLTSEQKTMIMRMAILRYLSDLCETRCSPESTDTKVLIEFAMMHWAEKARPIVEKHEAIYKKRHENLSIRIEKIEQQAEVMRIQAVHEAGALFRMVDGTVMNVTTGEVIDDKLVQMALTEVELPEIPVEEPLPCDEPESDIPTVSDPEPETWDVPEEDPYEFIPLEDEFLPLALPAANKPKIKGKGKKSGTNAKGKRLSLAPEQEKIAA